MVVLPYVRRPWELGYQGVDGLFADQAVICLGFFLASLALRPVCRSLLQRSLPWISMELRALAWSSLLGTSAALAVSRLLISTPEPLELLEACAKASALLFLWCNLYFSVKQYPALRQQRGLLVQEEAETIRRASEEYASRFTVRSGSRIQVISAQDVEWIAAAGDYSELHTRTAVHLLRETMKSLEQKLDPARFARIHRSRIVSLACVLELRSLENRDYVIKLSDGSKHRCSRTYANRIERWLDGNY